MMIRLRSRLLGSRLSGQPLKLRSLSTVHLPPPLVNYDLDQRSPDFQEAMARTKLQVEELNSMLEQVRKGGGESAVERHLKRNKFLPRDRIDRLVDPGTPVLELSALAGCDKEAMQTDEPIASGGLVCAIGIVAGKKCMLVANDATVKGM